MADNRIQIRISDVERGRLALKARKAGEPVSALVRRGIAWVVSLEFANTPDYRRDLQAFVLELRADSRTALAADDIAKAIDALDIEADGKPEAAALLDLMAMIAAAPWPLVCRLSVLLAVNSYQGNLAMERSRLTGSNAKPETAVE